MRRIEPICCGSAAILLALGPIASAQTCTPRVDVQTIARTGDEPVDRPGEEFSGFDNPSISADGVVVFRAMFDGPLSGNEGIYRFTDAGLTVIIDDRFGAAPPGQGGSASWSGFGPPGISDAGHIAFTGRFSFGDNEHGVYVWTPTGFAKVFDDHPLQPVPGQAPPMPPVPPGGPGFTTFPYGASLLPLVGADGSILTTAEFRGADLALHYGIYIGRAGDALVRVADSTEAPPAQPDTARFDDLGVFTRLVMNDVGGAAFLASYTGGLGTSGLYVRSEHGVLVRAVDTTMSPPGQPGARFAEFDPIFSMNNSGALAFAARTTGGVGNRGVYVWSPDADLVTIVDNSGAFPVPERPRAAFSLVGEPVMNGEGDVVFAATLVGGTANGGVYLARADASELVRVLDLAQPVPGISKARFSAVGHRTLNRDGHVALTALYTGASAGNEGVYLFADGNLHRVIDESERVDGAFFEDLQMMATVGAGGSGGEDGKPGTLSDGDALTFWARLTNGGQGVYRAQVTICPSDLNADDVVGAADLESLLLAWGPCPDASCCADRDGDRAIGFTDLVVLLHDWGPCGQ